VYTAADGLPDGNVSSIYQDSKGYLWLGTRTSLCRFNGREFVNYGKELGNSHITGSMVLED
jgi:ligand-binding sensor domain-containing protein